MTDANLEFHAVATTSEVSEDEPKAVSIGRMDIGIYLLDGEYYALDDICTHAYALMTDGYIEDGAIECPLHGACFDIKSGKALTAPATIDLRPYEVKIEGDQILVGVPKAED
ncbi:MAG: ferredoxin [Rhodospirillaceae bacterium]|nr:ferredoxin [Rhodospirillaceae bacterium]|tara:strand:+ start:3723 stop:4058 length:336 start_codon:yes stop_codon:yes gene_type:complete